MGVYGLRTTELEGVCFSAQGNMHSVMNGLNNMKQRCGNGFIMFDCLAKSNAKLDKPSAPSSVQQPINNLGYGRGGGVSRPIRHAVTITLPILHLQGYYYHHTILYQSLQVTTSEIPLTMVLPVLGTPNEGMKNTSL